MRYISPHPALEFFAEKVQLKMMKLGIKFKPNRPGSPHLNGKVECSQKTDLEEFYAIADLSNFENLREELSQWQFFYNWQRPHGCVFRSKRTLISVLLERRFRLSRTSYFATCIMHGNDASKTSFIFYLRLSAIQERRSSIDNP